MRGNGERIYKRIERVTSDPEILHKIDEGLKKLGNPSVVSKKELARTIYFGEYRKTLIMDNPEVATLKWNISVILPRRGWEVINKNKNDTKFRRISEVTA